MSQRIVTRGARRTNSATNSGLFIGRQLASQTPRSIGFGCVDRPIFVDPIDEEPLTYSHDGHAITFCPTGGGKGVCSVIPNALRHPGQLIVFDPKGEVHEITSRQRRRFGPVHRLHLGDSEMQSDTLNPMDLMRRNGSDLAGIARSFAAELVERGGAERDCFWTDWAETMTTGSLVWQMTCFPPEDQRLSQVFDLLTSDDVAYAIAVLLDSGKIEHRAARAAFTSFLQLPERETRPCVLASTLQHFRLFDSDLVRRVTDTTSIDLDGLIEGRPMTLYITVPPARMNAFRPLVRCWLTGILNALTQRTMLPEHNTLILCDEAASLGRSESLLMAATLLRGWGVQLWTFWQSPAQLEIYGADARTLVDNAGMVQCFGAHNLRAANDFANLIGGVDAETVLALSRDEQIVLMEGARPMRARRVRFFQDSLFAGQFDVPRMLRTRPGMQAVR